MKILFFLIAFSIGMSGFAQQRASPHDTLTNGKVTVTYGRPYKKDRVIFGGLEPYGIVWRLGADEATQVSFATDVKMGGQPVKAGTYTMFAVPRENEWGIILNSQLGQWGAFSYDKIKDKNVARFTIPVKTLERPVEQLTIRFAADKSMIIEWDKTQVTIPISY